VERSSLRVVALAGLALAAAAASVALWAVPGCGASAGPIRVGLLHSLTGPMAISEKSMVDAEVLALEQIRDSGGLLGRRVEWVVADGRSDPVTFAAEARRLIEAEKVSALIGCWTSACRKSVKPVVEAAGHLLVYPVAYEGLEESPNIVYTGAAPNQQIIPTVTWARDVLRAKTFYLIGTDSVWPRAVSAIVKDQLASLRGTQVVGEDYLNVDTRDARAAVAKVVKARPDVVFSILEGETNLPFYQAMREAGGAAADIPVVSYSLTEEELRALPTRAMKADYLVCNYFQAIERPQNEEFVGRFRARYGSTRVTSDTIDTAYNSVRMWAQAVRDAETDDVGLVRDALLRQSLNAAEGVISVDRDTQHTWRPFFVGKVRGDGQVEIVSTLNKPIRPTPFPYSRTRGEWGEFLDGLYRGWNGGWLAPTKATAPGRPS
jgi:urea transport system substrate-binding protein